MAYEVMHGLEASEQQMKLNEVALCGPEAVFQIKQYHANYPKEYIKDALNDAPGGIHILLEGKAQNEVHY
jgi:hypothetical protein